MLRPYYVSDLFSIYGLINQRHNPSRLVRMKQISKSMSPQMPLSQANPAMQELLSRKLIQPQALCRVLLATNKAPAMPAAVPNHSSIVSSIRQSSKKAKSPRRGLSHRVISWRLAQNPSSQVKRMMGHRYPLRCPAPLASLSQGFSERRSRHLQFFRSS